MGAGRLPFLLPRKYSFLHIPLPVNRRSVDCGKNIVTESSEDVIKVPECVTKLQRHRRISPRLKPSVTNLPTIDITLLTSGYLI